MARRYFTLAVLFVAMAAWGQEDAQQTGTAGQADFGHPLCTGCWQVAPPQTTPSTHPDSISPVDVPPITREYSGPVPVSLPGGSWNPLNWGGPVFVTQAQTARVRQQWHNIWTPGPLAKWGGPAGYGIQVVGGLMNLMCGPIGCGVIAGFEPNAWDWQYLNEEVIGESIKTSLTHGIENGQISTEEYDLISKAIDVTRERTMLQHHIWARVEMTRLGRLANYELLPERSAGLSGGQMMDAFKKIAEGESVPRAMRAVGLDPGMNLEVYGAGAPGPDPNW